MPRPFVHKEFLFTQPDGTEITLFGTGNPRFAVFEDAAGYVVIRDPETGYYQYAKLNATETDFEPTGAVAGRGDPAALGVVPHLRVRPRSTPVTAAFAPSAAGEKPRWQQRIEEMRRQRLQARAAAREGLVLAPPSRQTVGDYIGLCMLIEFPDVPATIAKSEVEAFCNQAGYTGFGNNGSVHDYFLDVSNGRLRYTNVVTPYYTASHPRAYYTDESLPFGLRARELILEALNHFKSNGFDFSALTTDSAGFIRALNIYYAGGRVNNWSKGLWPHSWRLASPFEAEPGKNFLDYQFTNMGNELELGTFCHENGHMICDFPDLYDYGADNFRSSGIGHFCLMCSGGRDEKNPVRVGAYLSRLAGWAEKVTTVAPGLTGSLPADRNEFLIHSRTADEYFIIEHRRASGRDADLPSSGLAIWHVDHDGSNENQQATAALHYECQLEQADGHNDLERGANQGDAGDLFSAATSSSFGEATDPDSRWWDGTPSGLDIRDIGAAEGGSIAYRVAGGPEDVALVEGNSRPGMQIPDDDAAGISDVISLDEEGLVDSIAVEVDISHSYRGDLLVRVRAPSGAVALLHNRQGASANDIKARYDSDHDEQLGGLLREPIHGGWSLEVADLASRDTGTLNSWSLAIRPATAGAAEIGEAPGIRIPDNDAAGIVRTLAATGAGTVANLSVAVDITHSFIRDLVVTLVSPQGTRIALHNRSGGGADNIIQTFTSATTPALATLDGKRADGEWRLEVSDHELRDVGKLNRWSLRFQNAGVA